MSEFARHPEGPPTWLPWVLLGLWALAVTTYFSKGTGIAVNVPKASSPSSPSGAGPTGANPSVVEGTTCQPQEREIPPEVQEMNWRVRFCPVFSC